MPDFILDPDLFTSPVAAGALVPCAHGKASAVW